MPWTEHLGNRPKARPLVSFSIYSIEAQLYTITAFKQASFINSEKDRRAALKP